MLSFLDRLRAKPPAARQRVALLSAVSVTLVITAIWAVSLPARFSPETTVQTASTPFASLGSAIKDQWNAVRSSLPQATTTPTVATEIAPSATTSEITTTSSTSSRIEFGEIDTTEPTIATTSRPMPPVSVLIATMTATTTTE